MCIDSRLEMSRQNFYQEEIEQSMRAFSDICVDDANKLAELYLKGEQLGITIDQSEVRKQFKELEELIKSIALSQKHHQHIITTSNQAESERREFESSISSVADLTNFEEVNTNLATRLDAFKPAKRRVVEDSAGFIREAMDAIKSAEDRLKRSRGSIEVVDNSQESVMRKKNLICPLTKKQFVNPVANKFCGHNYEKDAIENAIRQSERAFLCPYNCANERPVELSHLQPNDEISALLSRTGRLDNDDDESD